MSLQDLPGLIQLARISIKVQRFPNKHLYQIFRVYQAQRLVAPLEGVLD